MSQQMSGRQFPDHIGNYRLVRELGRGSMGTVYQAYQESLGRDLAIKVLAPEFTRDQEFVERFRREGQAAARLRHPNIVQVFDFSDRDGYYYIVMEYLGARTLREVITEQAPMDPVEVIKLTEQLLSALAHAHAQGIVHRDVKPANIMITDNRDAALTDFSIAHIKTASKLTQTGMMVGTPEYMAPEQFEGKRVDGRADLYATGVIMYEMLTGIQPFRGETTPEVMRAHFFKRPPDPAQLNPAVSAALGAVVMRALEKEAEQRYASADEMLSALKEAAGSASGAVLEQFLTAITSGKISLDEANLAREKVKRAIDEGYRKVLTFMMVDLAGSSKIKLPNQTLHADRAFRDYRATINAVLKGHGCNSYEWAGDGAICIFEDPLSAVSAALEVQHLVGEVAQRHPDLPDRLLARIGINTGEVYLDPRRSLGEFASRTVDQAGHIEKDCPPGSVDVGESTMKATSHAVSYSPVGINRDEVMVYRAAPGQLLRRTFEVGVAEPRPSQEGPPPVGGYFSGPRESPLRPPPKGATTNARFCAGCGTPALSGARFCPQCGFDMGSLVGATPVDPVPVPVAVPVSPAPPVNTTSPPPPVAANLSRVVAGPAAEPAPAKVDSEQRSPNRPPPVDLNPDSPPPSRPGPTHSEPAASGTDPKEPFTLWFGWWVGAGAFFMSAVGNNLVYARGPARALGGAMLMGGILGLVAMIIGSPVATLFYARRGSRLAQQARYGAVVFIVLFVVLLEFLHTRG